MNLPQRDTAQAQLDRALLALEAGRLTMADDHLRRALSLDPDLPEARLIEARLILAQQKPRQALHCIDLHCLQHPHAASSPQVLFLRAQVLLAGDDETLAQAALDELVQRFPDDARCWRMLVTHHLAAGRWEQARQAMGQLVRLSPGDAHLARMQIELLSPTQPQQAADLALLPQHPDDQPTMRLRAARNLRQVQRDREALDLYQLLLRDFAHDTLLHIEAAQLALLLGEYALAKRWLVQVQPYAGPHRPALLRQLAMAHMDQGDFQRAGSYWFSLIRQTPGHTTCSDATAGLLLCALLTHHDRLAHRLQRKLEAHSSVQERRRWMASLWPHVVLGQLLHSTTSTANTASVPVADDATSQPGPLLSQLLTTASRNLAIHVTTHPQRADAHYHLAVSRAALGQHAGADQSLQQALSLNPRYQAAQRLRLRLSRITQQAA